MQRNQGSKTAEIIAAVRAAHFAFDESPKVFEDPLAGDLITHPLYRLSSKNRMVFRFARDIL
ncbi:MAG TPA: hypothetical protein VM658_21960 [bacterium]|nr:hypothetical protein [bacterium]